ncbi:MAG: dihydrodipicolinate synthase family protein, partial [Paeniclostridium sordellii]|nr:dihydrodipicolinate synthase family protein [Paeniclostridium sordellii]
LPIILYNVPGRTGVNIKPSVIAELAKIENIVAVKEASGDIAQVAEIARLVPEGFAIYSGNDDSILPLLSLGGVGVISVVANICPKETHDLVEKFLNGDVKGSRELQLGMKALIDKLFIEVNPIPVKTAMNILGFEVGDLRLPLAPMEENNLKALRDELVNYGFEF